MIKLNADLGESFGNWQSDVDQDIMPYIDQANVACGFHAGDPKVLQATIQLVKQNKVSLGAHPSYPDLQGFGRRSMRIPGEDLIPIIHAQIAIVEGMAKCQGVNLHYVKPHGALYNDMMQFPQVFEDVVQSMASYHIRYPLMVQALASNKLQTEIARKFNVELIFEAFADRRYSDTGYLLSRQKQGAVLNEEQAFEQAKRLIHKQEVVTDSGSVVPIKASSLCVHADSPSALEMVRRIRQILV